MMTIKQIKTFAKRQLKGNLLSAIGAMILTFICTILWIAALVSAIFFGVVAPALGHAQLSVINHDLKLRLLFFAVAGIVIAAIVFIGIYMFTGLMLGSQMLYLDIAKGKRVGAFDIFKSFGNVQHMGNYFGVVVIIYLIEFIFMIPETIMGLRYGYRSLDYNLTSGVAGFLLFVVMLFLCMASFVSAAHPDMKATRAIAVSAHLMRKRKLKLVGFELSFIGWYILGVITGGLAFFWVIPYFNTAFTIFYLSAYGQDYESNIKDAEFRDTGNERAGDGDFASGVGAAGDAGTVDGDVTGGTYNETKDTYVRGDAVPKSDEPRRSFEEVRSQYTDIKDETSGTGAQSANSYEAGVEASYPQDTQADAADENPHVISGEWHSDDAGTPHLEAGADASNVTEVTNDSNTHGAAEAETSDVAVDSGDTAADAVSEEVEIKKSYKTEEDAFAAYTQWKKDHGITIENPDPFHNIYQSDGKITEVKDVSDGDTPDSTASK